MSPRKPLSGALTASVREKRIEEGTVVPGTCPNPSPMPAVYETLLPGVLDTIRNGGSVAAFAKANGVSTSALRTWVWRNHRHEYEEAQHEAADRLAEKAVEVALTANQSEEVIETTFADGSTTTATKSFDNTQRSKLAIDTMWRMAAAKNPEKYGNKANAAESAEIASALIEARKRVQSERILKRKPKAPSTQQTEQASPD